MSDYLAAVSAQLDREPICTCVSTDRGTDRLGCERHDDRTPPSACDGGLGEHKEESMRKLPNDWITRTIDNPRDRPSCPECLSRQTAPVFTPMYRCGACGTTFEAYKPNQRRIMWSVAG